MHEQNNPQPHTPEQAANYSGNWMLLQRERMRSDDFRAKFNALMVRQAESLPSGEPGLLEKRNSYRGHYDWQVGMLDATQEHVYSRVNYVAAGVGRAAALGENGGVGSPGTVFSDAGLTDRGKDIIAAHEAYHGIVRVNGEGSAKQEVLAGIDLVRLDKLTHGDDISVRSGYLKNPDEVLARMAQLKNYFGMTEGETFTAGHLEYATEHYAVDVGLDNSMSLLFACVKPYEFIRNMNTLPV